MNLFDISSIEKDLKTLESQTLESEFWNDSKNSKLVLQKIKNLKNKRDKFVKIKKELINLEEMNELLLVENDESLLNDILIGTKKLAKEIENLELTTLLSGKYDQNNAIITLHPGARAEQSHKIGQKCYIECILDGLLVMGILLKSWIT